MAEYESKTIIDIIDELNETIFLPAIQRSFVWESPQIEKLFDSIMGDYPISSFLFWKVKEANKVEWASYEFIRNFDQENPHNKEANLVGISKDIYLVLDGQQRLTSIYIGLKGSYRYLFYKWKKTNLYLNLLKKEERNEENPDELVYQFQFREPDEKSNPDKEYWYEVGRILKFRDPEEAKSDLDPEIKLLDDDKKANARRLVGKLHTRIHTYKLINYYEEKSQVYDKVVDVFIRANTGGKTLEYSDILLSTATAKWKKLNAREEIQDFTDTINGIGGGYRLLKDFVLKGCLYLTEDLPIQYKVKNFNKTNLEKIEANWDNIKNNIEDTIKLINKFGFNDKNIVSAGALLPISYYLFKLNKKNFVNSSNKDDVLNQNIIQKWLILVLLKNAFGGSSDTTLKDMRSEINNQKSYDLFPFEDLTKKLEITKTFSDDDLERLLNISYKSKYSFLTLSLLYPDRDWKDKNYQEDHIFPKSEFSQTKLKARGFDESKINSYRNYYNTIGNLQLLTDSENLEKKSKDFEDWINTRDKNFKSRHIIPEIKSYEFEHFLEFVEERRKIINEKLKSI